MIRDQREEEEEREKEEKERTERLAAGRDNTSSHSQDI